MKINPGEEFPFDNGYGRFEEDGWSYRITNPQTPRPWVNILANEVFGAVVSQAGGGYSWRENAQLNRITRWEQDLIKDEWGKFLYVRDADSQLYWSAAWKPVCAEPEQYACTHGIGFTRFESRHDGIRSDWTVFVPPKDPLEVWLVTLTNLSRVKRHLQLFTYFEWNLGAAPDWHREFHRSFIKTAYEPSLGALVATKRLWEVPSDRGHWNRDWEYVAFHGCSEKPISFDGDKESFLGMYRSQRAPRAVEQGCLGRQVGDGLDAIASLQTEVTLEPGDSTTVAFTIGAARNRAETRRLIRKYSSVSAARSALAQTKAAWRTLLTRFEVKTPDRAMNILLSPWLQYQAIAGRIWGRTGYYQTGGAFGFRDQLQDSQIFLPLDPALTAKQILLHARHQFKDGTVYHWWHPLSEIGLTTQMTDDLLWLPYLLNVYLEETGEYGFLSAKETFVDDKRPATLYDHSVRAIECVLGRMSKRGLPYIGAGDWNDGLSAVGLGWKGESVWLGQFLHRILVDFQLHCQRMKDHARAKKYQAAAARLRTSLNRYGWDGEYYYGATKDNGERVGSARNKEGRVWLNTQTWAILGDVADAKRAEQVFRIIESKLEGKNGTLLVSPAYTVPDRQIGYLTRYAAGMRENGGVYTHAATWSILAATRLQKAAAAYRLFCKLSPVLLGSNPNEYVAEPYVTSGNIEGPGSRFYGKGGWTWYSGSAAWLFKAACEGILGIKASFDGLIVEPCIPHTWSSYHVKRTFRGAVYNITVDNPHGVSGGITSVNVDGSPLPLAHSSRKITLPVFRMGTEHDVHIVLCAS
jgi:cellobiose phosphorylase